MLGLIRGLFDSLGQKSEQNVFLVKKNIGQKNALLALEEQITALVKSTVDKEEWLEFIKPMVEKRLTLFAEETEA